MQQAVVPAPATALLARRVRPPQPEAAAAAPAPATPRSAARAGDVSSRPPFDNIRLGGPSKAAQAAQVRGALNPTPCTAQSESNSDSQRCSGALSSCAAHLPGLGSA